MKKKFDVIVVGELNVDLILNEIDSFPEIGKEKLADSMTLSLGSSSAIFAGNLSALGSSVSFLGKIGRDLFGDFVLDKLTEKGVDTSSIIRDMNCNTGATIVLNFLEDRAMVTYPGAMNELKINDCSEEVLINAKHLHFSSLFLQPGIKPDINRLFERAKGNKMTTSFDMQWDPSEKWDFNFREVLPNVDIFFPNEQELLKLTGETEISNALEHLSGCSNNIAVKMGSKGSLLFSKGKSNFLPAFINNKVVDAIGAGDSFNSGFIHKYISGETLEGCQRFGNLMGAINTTAAGGTAAFKDYSQIMNLASERFGYKE